MTNGISGTSSSKYRPPHARKKIELNKNNQANKTVDNDTAVSQEQEKPQTKILTQKYLPPHQKETQTMLNSTIIQEDYFKQANLFDDAVVINESNISHASKGNK